MLSDNKGSSCYIPQGDCVDLRAKKVFIPNINLPNSHENKQCMTQTGDTNGFGQISLGKPSQMIQLLLDNKLQSALGLKQSHNRDRRML